MAEVSLRNYQKQVEAYLRDERLEEAVAHSSHILGSYPKNAVAYRTLGGALLLQKRYEESEEMYRRLLGVYPNDYEANINLSRIYEALGQSDFALWYAERALDQRPNDRQTNDHMRKLVQRVQGIQLEKIQLTAGAVANQYLKAGRTAQAIELLQTALEESPERVDLRLRLAQAFWRAGAFVESAETSLEVLQTLPYAAEANGILAQLWLEEGRPSDAQRYLSRIEAVAPYDALALATNTEPDINAYTVEELNFAQYAASVDVDSPDWLESLGEDDFQTSSELPPLDMEADTETENYDIEDLFGELGIEDDDDEPAQEPMASAETNDDDFFASLGEFEDEEQSDPSQMGTGLTDLLGMDDVEVDEDQAPPQETASESTGLTGLLNLPDEEEENIAEEDLSLDDLFTSIEEEEADFFSDFEEADAEAQSVADGTIIFDEETGEGDAEDLFADMDEPQAPEGATTLFDDMPDELPRAPEGAPSTTDFFGDLPDDWDPKAAEELANRFVDETPEESQNLPTEQLADGMDWMQDLPQEQEDDEEDSDDPLAWMRDSDIEFDEQSLGGGTGLFDDEDEDSAFESEESDPFAWMQSSGIEYEGGDSNKFVIPEELQDAIELPDDTMEFDDPEGPTPPAEMLYQEQESSGTEDDWLADDDILDEMLNLEALTDEPDSDETVPDDLFADMDWQATMNDQPERNENDNTPGDDENFEWFDDDQFQDDIPPAEEELGDPMAWLNEAGVEIDDEEQESEEDPMAWLNEAGVEIDDDTDANFDPQTSVTDLFGESDPLDEQQMGATDYLVDENAEPEASEPAEEPSTGSGLTGMLNFADDFELSADQDDDEPVDADLDWLSALDAEETADEDEPQAQSLDWLADESAEPDADSMDWGEVGPAFTDQLPDMSEEQPQTQEDWGAGPAFTDQLSDLSDASEEPQAEQNPDWANFEEGFTEEMDSDELGWLGDDAQLEEEPWADLNADEQPAAQAPETEAESPEQAEEWLNAFQEEDSEELDWLSALSEPEATDDEAESEPVSSTEEDPFGFGDMSFGEPEPAADADWLNDFDDQDESTEEDFFAPQEDASPQEDFFSMNESMDEGMQEPSATGDDELAAADVDWLNDFTVEEEGVEEDFFSSEELAPSEQDFFSMDESVEEAGAGDAGEGELAAADADWLNDFAMEEDSVEEDLFTAMSEQADGFGEEYGEADFEEEDDEDFEAIKEGLNWLDATEPEEEEPLPFEEQTPAVAEEQPLQWEDDEEEEILVAPAGMTDMLQSIRDEEPEARAAQEEPEDEFGAFEFDDAFAEEPQQPQMETPQEDEINWGDLEGDFQLEPEATAEDEWLDDFDEFDEVDDAFALEEAAASLEEPDAQYEEEPLYDDDDYEEELDFAPTENVPDWLNAMVPGLDINYSAEEDAPVEDTYEENTSHRTRIQTESEQTVTSTGDFGWLQDIVDEEVTTSTSEERGSEGGRRQRFIFSRLPRWLMRTRQNAQSAVTTPSPTADREEPIGNDELDDFDLEDFDDLDDDFEFDDFE